ncbi:MAG TPA: GFA family protein [Kofleriaceae bacterium]|nr:GFA family protein [Kofleriaceae bacterium]
MTTYQGSCHCGAVRYTADVDLGQPVNACNCSMCGRSGTLLTFVPADKFTLEQGSESLTDYMFHKHNIHHLFCKVCGIKPFARGVAPNGKEVVAVNARCLAGVDPSTLQIKQIDGAKF